ncbi:MAG: hypothetical protein PGN22_15780 [Agrobacterium cavarae]
MQNNARRVAALAAMAEAGVPVDVQELLLKNDALDKALDAASGVPSPTMKEMRDALLPFANWIEAREYKIVPKLDPEMTPEDMLPDDAVIVGGPIRHSEMVVVTARDFRRARSLLSAKEQDAKELGVRMSLPIALDFADNPRPYHTLQAPADSNGELYRALKTLAAAYRSAQVQDVAGWKPPQACDGKEQLAFEAWAVSQRYDMHEHPLHYIFMDPKTSAARLGWNAALQYVRDQFAASPAPNKGNAE